MRIGFRAALSRLSGHATQVAPAVAALGLVGAFAAVSCDGPAASAEASGASAAAAASAGSGGAPGPRLVVVKSRAVRALITRIRDKSSDSLTFATYADRLMT